MMAIFRNFLRACLLLPMLCSCVRDVTMDATEDPTPVVVLILDDGPEQTLRLSYTKSASRAEAPELPEATAVLTDLTEGKEAGRFARVADGSWRLAYAAIPKHSYRLDVSVPGHEPIWAEQTMPEAPGINVSWDWWREDLPADAKYRMVHGYVFSAGDLRSPTWFYGINYPDAQSPGEVTESLYTDFPDVDPFNEIPASTWSGDESMTWGCWFRTSTYPDLAGAQMHRRYLRFPERKAERTDFLVSGDFRNYLSDPKDFVRSDKRFSELHFFSASEDFDHYLLDSYLLDQAGSSTDLSEVFLRENVFSNVQGAAGILGAKVERSVRWDDDSHWGEGPFCLSGFEKGATRNPDNDKYDYGAAVGADYQQHKPFSLLLYEVQAGHPEAWKFADKYDPEISAGELYAGKSPAFYRIENEAQMQEHGIADYGPVDFSTKTVLIAYLSDVFFALPFVVDWQVQEDRQKGSCTMTFFLIYMYQRSTSHVKYVGNTLEFDPFTSSRVAVVVDKADALAFKDVDIRFSSRRIGRFDSTFEENILPQLGVTFPK